jgi:hypothetical protein
MIINIQHYIKQLKEHEAKRLSTNERNAYWKQYLSKLKEQNNENV